MVSRVYIGRLGRDVRDRDVENFFKGYGRLSGINLKDGFGFVNFEEKRDADDAVYDLNGKQLCGERVIIEHARAPNSNRRNDTGNGRGRGGFGDFFRGRDDGRYRDSGGYNDRGGFRGDRDWGFRDRSGYRGGGYSGDGYRSNNFRGRNQPIRTDNKILVENIPGDVSWQDLKDLMKKAGEVTFADAHKLRRGEGIVEFSNSGDMKRAIEKFDGYELQGKKLRVRDAKRDESRSRSRSRSYDNRSRSYSRSADRSGSRKSDDRSRSRSRDRSERSRSKSVERSRSRSASEKKDVSDNEASDDAGDKKLSEPGEYEEEKGTASDSNDPSDN